MPKKEIVEQDSWDKQKIIIAILALLVLLFAFLYIKDYLFPNKNIQVQGEFSKASTAQEKNISKASEQFQNKLDEIQQNVGNLNAVDVATSTPQVQKVLNDLKSLQDLPRDQAREACQRICSGL